jgi:hypothetical protein
MTKKCITCGRSDSQVIADAKALGLLQELQGGKYTCCQISEWGDEQWLAWSQAADEDANHADRPDNPRILHGNEPVLVPVRFRRPQVPWYTSPDELS